MKTTRDSLAIDDLIVGARYEFITPSGRVYRGAWLGIEGRMGFLEIPLGTWALMPVGTAYGRAVRFWAACIITAMEPVAEESIEPAPVPQSDVAVVGRGCAAKAWPVVTLCIAVWGVDIVWVLWHIWFR